MNNLYVAIVKPKSAIGYMNIKYMRFPSIGALTIASFLKKNGYKVRFIDLDFDKLNPIDYDIVLISMTTPEAIEGYKIADKCRKMGIPVIGGGCHVTLKPNEAKKHFDIIVVGDGISAVLTAIKKAIKGKKGVVKNKICSNERLNLTIDSSLFNRKRYTDLNFIITSFGCPHSCSFCCIWKLYKKKVFWKDNDVVEREVRNFKKNQIVFFLDDDLNSVKPNVFKLMKIYGYKFVGEASLDFVKSDRFKLAVECGLIGLSFGFESIDNRILEKLNKNQSIEEYDEIIKIVKDNKLILFGLFILDPDIQTKKDMENLVNYTIKKNFDFAQFAILTPFPGTELRKQIKNRVFDKNWGDYTTLKCVFHPKQMSCKEADEMIKTVHKKFYSIKSILKRMFHTKRLGLFLAGNLITWRAIKKEWG